jgi:hypothetical protein
MAYSYHVDRIRKKVYVVPYSRKMVNGPFHSLIYSLYKIGVIKYYYIGSNRFEIGVTSND